MSLIVSLFKWPTALLVAAVTPAAVLSTWDLLQVAWAEEFWRSPFSNGFIATFSFLVLFHRLRFLQLLATIDHEVTHALFAWLTFVPVHAIQATDGTHAKRNGGRLGYVALGGDNWLITIAPYFFPTAAILILVLSWLLAAEPTNTARVLLGAATAWSIVSTWHETHMGQSDLKQVGHGFAFLLLPGANLLCYGALLANELGGLSRSLLYTVSALDLTVNWLLQWMPT